MQVRNECPSVTSCIVLAKMMMVDMYCNSLLSMDQAQVLNSTPNSTMLRQGDEGLFNSCKFEQLGTGSFATKLQVSPQV